MAKKTVRKGVPLTFYMSSGNHQKLKRLAAIRETTQKALLEEALMGLVSDADASDDVQTNEERAFLARMLDFYRRAPFEICEALERLAAAAKLGVITERERQLLYGRFGPDWSSIGAAADLPDAPELSDGENAAEAQERHGLKKPRSKPKTGTD